VKKVGGRVLVLAPPEPDLSEDDGLDRTALTAIATAFHWQDELESGKYPSQRQLAAAKGLHYSVVRRQLKLAFLDPYIIRQILKGRQPSGFSIVKTMHGLPLKWEDQRRKLGF
jgi:hypothetical protein